jgi:hypothetical protein
VARRKTVTPQTIVGEKGINLIERRCLEMGYLFHPRRVDHGIDGHIDLVDPGSRALLNQVLLCRAKRPTTLFRGRLINRSGMSAMTVTWTCGCQATPR